MEDYQRVEKALEFLEDRFQEQPTLDEVARAVHVSPYHFQRLFKRWAGVSPKRFLQFLTLEHAKRMLEESASVLETSLESGLSGPGRLHDLFVSVDAVTPGEYKSGGAGLEIDYGWLESPFGRCLLGVTDRGVCHLSFPGAEDRKEHFASLRRRWKRAALKENADRVEPWLERVFSRPGEGPPVPVLLKGTNFQLKVWKALLEVPPGRLVCYQDIARQVCASSATRAVANAVGANPVAYLIPCHRVIRKMGGLGGYRWGLARKRAMIGWESARQDVEAGNRLAEVGV